MFGIKRKKKEISIPGLHVQELLPHQGSLAEVRKAVDEQTGDLVVIKISDRIEDIEHETKALLFVHHPAVVHIRSYGETDDHRRYVILDYLDGNNLKELLDKKAISSHDALKVCADVAGGLHALHQQGKHIHGDVKPANIVVLSRSRPYRGRLGYRGTRRGVVIDLGTAHSLEEAAYPQETITGTPYYISPEQFRNCGMDHRADLYSLGMTMFRVFTGTLPYTGSVQNILYAQVHYPVPEPIEYNEHMPDQLSDLIYQLLQKDPGKRPQTAKEVQQRLYDLLKKDVTC